MPLDAGARGRKQPALLSQQRDQRHAIWESSGNNVGIANRGTTGSTRLSAGSGFSSSAVSSSAKSSSSDDAPLISIVRGGVGGNEHSDTRHDIWTDSVDGSSTSGPSSGVSGDVVGLKGTGVIAVVSRAQGTSSSTPARAPPPGNIRSEMRHAAPAPSYSEPVKEPPKVLKEAPNLSQLLHQGRSQALEEVARSVPLDEDGQPTSIGSIMHEYGRCKICVCFVRGDPTSCRKGVRCRYCHFSHISPTTPAKAARNQWTKPDRIAYRKYLWNVEQHLLRDRYFNISALEMPVFNKPSNRHLTKRLQGHANQLVTEIRTGRPGPATEFLRRGDADED